LTPVEPVHRLQRRSSGEQVADHLRREIFAGRIPPGTKISHEAVAADLGVSRVPVREALVILEREGRVRMEMHRGAFVLPMDAASVRDNAEIYGMVYAFIARRAAERVTEPFAERLAELADRMRAAESPLDIWGLAERYLDTVMEIGAAPRLAHVLRRMRALSVDNLFEVVPGAIEITKTGTMSLIEAIRSGDADRAAAEQMDMQRRSADLVVEAFRARGMLDEATS
jgi:DNA-binding GntR family transcriptional regulator